MKRFLRNIMRLTTSSLLTKLLVFIEKMVGREKIENDG
jgi:hypothetical protein